MSDLKQSNEGKVLLELLLVVPILLATAVAALELCRLLRVSEAAAAVVRESAHLAYRSCADFIEPPPPRPALRAATAARTTSCAEDVREEMEAFLGELGIDARLSLSIYRYDSTQAAAPELWRVAQLGQPAACAAGVCADSAADGCSRFCIDGGGLSGPDAAVSQAEAALQQRIVVAEVFVDYRPVIAVVPVIGRLFERTYYEAALY